MGVKLGFVEKAGAWYSVGSERIGQGKDNARDYLKANPKMATALEAQIKDKLLAKSDDDLNQDTGAE